MIIYNRDAKSVLKFTIQMIIVWILAFYLLIFLRTFAIEQSRYFEQVKAIDWPQEFVLAILAGILTGIFYTTIELLFDRSYFQKMSFGKIIFIKNVFYFIAVKIIFLIVTLFYTQRNNLDLNFEGLRSVMTSRMFWLILAYIMIVSIIITFVLQVSQKFGPGMLWKFITGKYHHPKEEERIFLFVDLRDSTTIAEQLGHLKFSRLIQDCFFDLTNVIAKHRVDIYQYVGDEAILSWEKSIGITDNRCVWAYYDYMEILRSRKDYYLEQYGLEPFFKAGLHFGKVTVAEVGVIKREIAYHGDVLNTTARIQGECNKIGQPLLASEAITKSLALGPHFKSELLATTLLKGKLQPVKIYGVRQN